MRDTGDYRASLADYEHLFELDSALSPGHYLSAAKMMVSLPERGVDDALSLLDARMEQMGVTSPLQRYAISLEVERENYVQARARLATLDQKLRATPEWKAEMAE